MNVESEWLKLALNLLGVVSIGVAGYLNNRVSRLEEWVKQSVQTAHGREAAATDAFTRRLRETEENARSHATAGDDRLWVAFTRHAEETRDFRERIIREGATKADVATLKVDLKEHINTALAGAVASIKNG